MCKKKYCRYCKNEINDRVIDLGLSPLSNDYISEDQISKGQYSLPLEVLICKKCKLVQVADIEMPDKIFNSDYKYFSSYSSSWLEHCKRYVSMIVKKLNLNSESRVVEIASNDGYLLQYFKEYDISPLGIEPSNSTAEVAISKGIRTIIDFFGVNLATKMVKENQKADLIIGNNVLAHVPDIADFIQGVKILLDSDGTATFEFPHFLNIIRFNQFDTIYHEHFSYLTILALNQMFYDNGLKIYDIEKLNTHGGSLRIYVTHLENKIEVSKNVQMIIKEENDSGLDIVDTYRLFSENIIELKLSVVSKLIELRQAGKNIVGYGAAAKGNTLLNYFGIKPDLISYVVDANPHKQGLFLPGSLIPIYSPDMIKETRPDYVVIIPWNIKDEIEKELEFIREWGGKFITFIPDVMEW